MDHTLHERRNGQFALQVTGLCAPEEVPREVEGWLDLVRTMWPECPTSIDNDGTGLFLDRANAVLPAGGTDARH